MFYTLVLPDKTTIQTTIDQLIASSPYTILYFYPKDDTPWCTREAQAFSELIDEFTQLGIQIVGVSRDSATKHCAFIEKYTLQPSYLSDPEGTLHRSYGARGTKKLYGKTSEWVIRSTVVVDENHQLLHRRPSVTVDGHAHAVLERCTHHLQAHTS